MNTYSKLMIKAVGELREPWHQTFCDKLFYDKITKRQAFYDTAPRYVGADPIDELSAQEKNKMSVGASSLYKDRFVAQYILSLSESTKPIIDNNYIADRLINLVNINSATYTETKGKKEITKCVDAKAALVGIKMLGDLNTVGAFVTGAGEKEDNKFLLMSEADIDKAIKKLVDRSKKQI